MGNTPEERMLAGAQAEKIFQLLHQEIGCTVYRTGTEHLHPHLYDAVSRRRKRTNNNQNYTKAAYEAFSNPDFTVITPKGGVAQFEVKYRKNGKLTDDEKIRYLQYHPHAFIFLVCGTKPGFRIFAPYDRMRDELKEGLIGDIIGESELFGDEMVGPLTWDYKEIELRGEESLYVSIDGSVDLLKYPIDTLEKFGRLATKWIVQPKDQ